MFSSHQISKLLLMHTSTPLSFLLYLLIFPRNFRISLDLFWSFTPISFWEKLRKRHLLRGVFILWRSGISDPLLTFILARLGHADLGINKCRCFIDILKLIRFCIDPQLYWLNQNLDRRSEKVIRKSFTTNFDFLQRFQPRLTCFGKLRTVLSIGCKYIVGIRTIHDLICLKIKL